MKQNDAMPTKSIVLPKISNKCISLITNIDIKIMNEISKGSLNSGLSLSIKWLMICSLFYKHTIILNNQISQLSR